jgi:hypothetical protein
VDPGASTFELDIVHKHVDQIYPVTMLRPNILANQRARDFGRVKPFSLVLYDNQDSLL